MADEKPKYLDKKLSKAERKADYAITMDKMMNPVEPSKFKKDTFEPMGDDMFEIADRIRTEPAIVLPTFGMLPKKVREGQMIGMYESKQDIYLTFALRCNALQAEVDALTARIEALENN